MDGYICILYRTVTVGRKEESGDPKGPPLHRWKKLSRTGRGVHFRILDPGDAGLQGEVLPTIYMDNVVYKRFHIWATPHPAQIMILCWGPIEVRADLCG